VVLLGATGSVGRSTVQVIREMEGGLVLQGLAAHSNVDAMFKLIQEFHPPAVCMVAPEAARALRDRMQDAGVEGSRVLDGPEGLVELAALPEADIVLCAIVGIGGLPAVLSAVDAGKDVALASKEVLVCAGDLVMRAVAARGVRIIPVDSEHSAVFQCIQHRGESEIRKIYLTASGGPFRTMSGERMRQVTVEDALRHPSWNMGPKITIDSATLMNKGLEVIEAHHLFRLPFDRIGVIVHPQSVIHSLVELVDGAVLAQLGVPDMRHPIQYALTYPHRHPASLPALDLASIGALEFEPPDIERFPCLGAAYQAGRAGGTAPAVLNAANEVAVGAFLGSRITFAGIPQIVDRVMQAHEVTTGPNLEEILRADDWARKEATKWLLKD
jgi:1-deoxy-D-xylulose-5-phosphate reductoisomerase